MRRAEIIERLEKAEGADRELDADIDIFLFGGETVWKQANYTMEMYPASRRASKNHVGGFANEHVPLYTASLDSAIALVERIEHAYGRKIICFHAGGQLMAGDMDYDPRAKPDNSVTVGWCAHVAFFNSSDANSTFGPDQYSHARTPALAVLTALFRALEAKETGNG